MPWIFFDYLSEREVNEIEEWEDTLPTKAALRVEWVLAFLRGVAISGTSVGNNFALPAGEAQVFMAAGECHLEAGLRQAVGGDYVGEHWLASFAALALGQVP